MTIRLIDGDAAPPFTLPDADGKNVSLADFPGQRVIVYFYPAAMTPGCTTQAVDFTAAMEELGAAGLHVIGISPDAQEKLIQFRAKESVGFPLLSDPRQVDARCVRRVRREAAVRQVDQGSDPIDFRDRRRPEGRTAQSPSPSTTSRPPGTSTSSSETFICKTFIC